MCKFKRNPNSRHAIECYQTLVESNTIYLAKDRSNIVIYEVAMGQVFSEYFGFSWQSSFRQILNPHNHTGQVQ
jgi:hypothetical protein